MRPLVLITILACALGACREEPSEADCDKVGKKRQQMFFSGKSDRQSQKAGKMEYEASFKECMASYTKKQAECIAEARTRNQMISCRK